MCVEQEKQVFQDLAKCVWPDRCCFGDCPGCGSKHTPRCPGIPSFNECVCVCVSIHQSQPDVGTVWLQGSCLSVHLQGLLVASCVVVQSSKWSQNVHLPRHLQRPVGKGQRSQDAWLTTEQNRSTEHRLRKTYAVSKKFSFFTI